jgi:hypothetical protein
LELCGSTQLESGLWYATFETREQYGEPELNIATMLGIVESLDQPLHSAWSRCTIREFNIGYDCGSKPWAFNQALSNELLSRIAAAGASLRWTLYPPARDEHSETSAGASAIDE